MTRVILVGFIGLILSACSAQQSCEFHTFTVVANVSALNAQRVRFELPPDPRQATTTPRNISIELDYHRYPQLLAELGARHRLLLRNPMRGDCDEQVLSAVAIQATPDTLHRTAMANPYMAYVSVFKHAIQCVKNRSASQRKQARCLDDYAALHSPSAQKKLARWLRQIELRDLTACNKMQQQRAAQRRNHPAQRPHTTLCAHYQRGLLHNSAQVLFARNKQTGHWQIIALTEL